jgi:ferredoxin
MPTVSLITENEEKKFEVKDGELIWDELERLGTKLPAGCLAGSCGTCRINVLEGEDSLAPKGAIETETVNHLMDQYKKKYGEDFLRDKTIRLACRARIKGSLKFTPLKEKI